MICLQVDFRRPFCLESNSYCMLRAVWAAVYCFRSQSINRAQSYFWWSQSERLKSFSKLNLYLINNAFWPANQQVVSACKRCMLAEQVPFTSEFVGNSISLRTHVKRVSQRSTESRRGCSPGAPVSSYRESCEWQGGLGYKHIKKVITQLLQR